MTTFDKSYERALAATTGRRTRTTEYVLFDIGSSAGRSMRIYVKAYEAGTNDFVWSADRKQAQRFSRENALAAATCIEQNIIAYYVARGENVRKKIHVQPTTGGEEVSRSGPEMIVLPHYDTRQSVWRGGDSHRLYAFTDKRTGHVFIRPGDARAVTGIGPEVTVRPARRAEAAAWQSPLHSGWKVEE